ncbi:MAG: DUF1338 domain-containing protein [Xenococcaceae cyanobacterium]
MKAVEIANLLWDTLWQDYYHRVEYARIYEQMIREAGHSIANDHIAFRSLDLTIDRQGKEINLGISYLAKIIEALGYEKAGEYEFSDRYLKACHYRHPEQNRFNLPKLFISELVVDALPANLAQQIKETVNTGSFFHHPNLNEWLTTESPETIIPQLKTVFFRPWQPPKRSLVEAVNAVTQYGAWVLLHGYAVNHFTGYINHHQTSIYSDIEKTAQALGDQGIPMKNEIEGSLNTGLRQTATVAVTEMVEVWDDNSQELSQIPWTYAYYEIAERNLIEGKLFEGFLDAQAKNLFSMTSRGDN